MNKKRRQSAETRGRLAEWLAAWYLRFKGYRILAQHEKTHVSEIDIIARRGSILAFVEVKARSGLDQGLSAISPKQRERVMRAASSFIATNPGLSGCDVRFDAIVISPKKFPIHMIDAWRP